MSGHVHPSLVEIYTSILSFLNSEFKDANTSNILLVVYTRNDAKLHVTNSDTCILNMDCVICYEFG